MNKYFKKENINFSSIPLPDVFYIDSKYKNLSSDAKILYGFLLKKTLWSLKNNWTDLDGKAYVYCERKEMAKILNISETTLRKSIKQLISVNLLEEVVVPISRVKKTYLLQPIETEKNENFLNSPSLDTPPVYDLSADFFHLTDSLESKNNVRPSNFNGKSKDFNSGSKNTIGSPLKINGQETKINTSPSKFNGDSIENYTTDHQNLTVNPDISSMSNSIYNNINNNILNNIYNKHTDIHKQTVVNIVCMSEEEKILRIREAVNSIMETKTPKCRIGKVYYDTGEIKQLFLRVDDLAVKYVIDVLNTREDIKHLKNFIIGVLFIYLKEQEKNKENHKPYKPGARFHNFKQRDYDYEQLMKDVSAID